MSSNQYRKARELENYYIYVVFGVKTENPRIMRFNPWYENKIFN